MTPENLLIIFAAICAVAFVVQCVFISLVLRSFSEMSKRTNKLTKDIERDIKDLVSELQSVVSSLDNLRSISDKFLDRSEELNGLIERRSKDLEELADTFFRVGTRQAENVDEFISNTVEKFEQTTSLIQRDILNPINEISSLIKGLRTALDFLFSRKTDRLRREDYPEEELFI